jgi:hypothetical protein
MGRIDVPSPNRVAAAELVRQLSQCRQIIEEVDRRGGIVVVQDEAQIDEPGRVKLVNSLKRIWFGARSFISAIGHDRRHRGVALPIPWFPESESPADDQPLDPAGD